MLDIDAADIGSYVAKLTPVVLRTDTAVTNHGFERRGAGRRHRLERQHDRGPLPMRDLRGPITDGSFSVGGSRTYDGALLEGESTARWSGAVGVRRTRPAEFPLTILHTWHRDRDAINWLRGSGGPPDYSCSYDVTAVRQG